MTPDTEQPDFDLRAPAAWTGMVFAIVPVLIILPMYVFPMMILDRPIGAYTGRRLLEVSWVTMLILALAWKPLRKAANSTWWGLPENARTGIKILLCGALVSALLSDAPVYALRGWAFLTTLLITTVILTASLNDVRDRLLEWLGLTMLLYGILVFPTPDLHGFANPRFQGQVLAVAAPVLLYSGNRTLALMAAPSVALGVNSGSRAFILTLVFVTLMAAILWSDRWRRLKSGLIGLGAASVLLFLLVQIGNHDELGRAIAKGASDAGRFEIWLETVRSFLRSPILGVGPGLLARYPGIGGMVAHPHNSVLLIAAETGLVGLAGAGMVVLVALRSLPSVGVERRSWTIGLLGGGFHSMFSGTIIMPTSQVLCLLTLSLVLPRPTGTPTAHSAGADYVLPTISSIALVVLLATLGLPRVLAPAPRFFNLGLIP